MKGEGYGQFCPVANAAEVFAGRWTPIILRELLAGNSRFNEIHRCIPLISRALLVRRLRELEEAGVVASTPAARGKGREYRLTEAGKEFKPALDALATWGQRWAARFRPENLDAGLLMWNMRKRIATDRLPAKRVVVYFSYAGLPQSYRGPRKFWMLLERSGVDVCLDDPGHEVDLYIDADIGAMARVWLGDAQWSEAVRERKVRMTGMPALAKQFPSWLLLSPFAGVPRPAATATG
jgi:DNA-binding HxlR family transcriptional regulator